MYTGFAIWRNARLLFWWVCVCILLVGPYPTICISSLIRCFRLCYCSTANQIFLLPNEWGCKMYDCFNRSLRKVWRHVLIINCWQIFSFINCFNFYLYHFHYIYKYINIYIYYTCEYIYICILEWNIVMLILVAMIGVFCFLFCFFVLWQMIIANSQICSSNCTHNFQVNRTLPLVLKLWM